MVLFFLLLIFKLTGCSDEGHILFEHFEDLKNLILSILKEDLAISSLVGSYNLEIV